MSFVSISFFFFSLAAIVLLRIPDRLIGKQFRVFVLNIWFVSSYFRSLNDVLPLFAFLAFGYFGVLSVARIKKMLVAPIFITATLILFIWMKRYAFLLIMEQHFAISSITLNTIGLSYILFRIIHLITDVSQGEQAPPRPMKYINYCLFFPNFVSGPIQRFQNFDLQITQPALPLDVQGFSYGVTRICRGIVAIVVVSAMASDLAQWIQPRYYTLANQPGEEVRAVLYLATASLLYLLNIYANFSGYMHIVIGVGKLCGFDIPENFNQPYRAKNFLDLWARWHITLSEWFKFYVFNPLLKAMVIRWDNPRWSIYFGSVAFFITFLVMGLWHGTSMSFVVYGLFLGLGAMLTKTWQVILGQHVGKKRYRSLTQKSWYFQFSRGLTLSYFAIALICLWLDPQQTAAIGKTKFIGQVFLAFIVISLAIVLIGIFSAFCNARFMPFFQRFSSTAKSYHASLVFSIAFQVFIAINVLAIAGGIAPEFIYKAF